MMANIIMPAIAARFFIYYLGLPEKVSFAGITIPTFMIIVAVTLFLAITIIYVGGTLSITITDTVQGLLFFPIVLLFIGYVLYKFSWSNEIVHVLSDRAAGESFLNPYDLSKLRNFNLFMLVVQWCAMFLHTASGLCSGGSNSAISAHESKMASILGAWRGAFTTVFFVLIAVAIVTIMNHPNFARDAKIIRDSISQKVANELIQDTKKRAEYCRDELISNMNELRRTADAAEPFIADRYRTFPTYGELLFGV
jgi:hypothetical protein